MRLKHCRPEVSLTCSIVKRSSLRAFPSDEGSTRGTSRGVRHWRARLPNVSVTTAIIDRVSREATVSHQIHRKLMVTRDDSSGDWLLLRQPNPELHLLNSHPS